MCILANCNRSIYNTYKRNYWYSRVATTMGTLQCVPAILLGRMEHLL